MIGELQALPNAGLQTGAGKPDIAGTESGDSFAVLLSVLMGTVCQQPQDLALPETQDKQETAEGYITPGLEAMNLLPPEPLPTHRDITSAFNREAVIHVLQEIPGGLEGNMDKALPESMKGTASAGIPKSVTEPSGGTATMPDMPQGNLSEQVLQATLAKTNQITADRQPLTAGSGPDTATEDPESLHLLHGIADKKEEQVETQSYVKTAAEPEKNGLLAQMQAKNTVLNEPSRTDHTQPRQDNSVNAAPIAADRPWQLDEQASNDAGQNDDMPNEGLKNAFQDRPVFLAMQETAKTDKPQKDEYGTRVRMENLDKEFPKIVSSRLQETNGRGDRDLVIELEPRDLGRLVVKLNSREGVVSLKVFVENAETRTLLENGMQNLRQSLLEQGIKYGRIDVELGGQYINQNHHQQQQPGWFQSKFSGGGMWIEKQYLAEVETAEHVFAGTTHNGSVDYMI